jgi:uncharacterized protein (UPF0335 family)
MTSQLTEIALQMLGAIERMELIIPEITDTIRKALEEEAALALRVQKLEAMRETEKAAVLDLYQQIDKLKARLDWQYTKIGRLEDVIANEAEA